MAKLRDTIHEDEDQITPLRVYKERVIKYVDSFIFRNHYVYINYLNIL